MLDRLNTGWRKKLPLVLQSEASECGLASLCMVASHFGHRSDLAELRRRYGMSLKGATLRELIRIADHMGFATRPLRLELEELGQLRTPCILHWDLNHFVVLERVTDKAVTIHDPAVGVRTLPIAVAAGISPASRWSSIRPHVSRRSRRPRASRPPSFLATSRA